MVDSVVIPDDEIPPYVYWIEVVGDVNADVFDDVVNGYDMLWF